MNSAKFTSMVVVSLFLAILSGCVQTKAEGPALEFGDAALVDFTLKMDIFNATTNSTEEAVYDTTIKSVAMGSGEYNENASYLPLIVVLDNSKLDSLPFKDAEVSLMFIRALVGMREGENKTFEIAAQDAYGAYNSSKVFSLGKTYSMGRYETAMPVYFRTKNISTEPGTYLSSADWKLVVVNSTNDSVLLKYIPEENQTFMMNGLPQKVVSFDDDNMTIEMEAEIGKRYITSSSGGEKFNALATAENETHIMFDANHPLAGKALKFTLFVKKIEKS